MHGGAGAAMSRAGAAAHGHAHCTHKRGRRLAPAAKAASTHLAPWSTICPAPSALWPTSLLPLHGSMGALQGNV